MCVAPIPEPAPFLRVCGVSKQYLARGGPWRKNHVLRAVEGVSFTLGAGTTMAIVGESGAGKSTLARCIAGLESPTSGVVRLGELEVAQAQQGRAQAGAVQLILQDSATALNPRFTAAEILAEPLVIHGVPREEIRARVSALMEAVALPSETAMRRPHQLSGGQRQRLAIGRALALRPSLLVLDEAFSGLDWPVQRRILKLLDGLQQRLGLTYLLISHDLRLMAAIADIIAIMYQGRIVEQGPARQVLREPTHPHTRALLASMPGRALGAGRS